jgi:hypothetical protein
MYSYLCMHALAVLAKTRLQEYAHALSDKNFYGRVSFDHDSRRMRIILDLTMNLPQTSLLQGSFYFGYMAIISLVLFLMLGSAGFQFSLDLSRGVRIDGSQRLFARTRTTTRLGSTIIRVAAEWPPAVG